MQRALQGLSSQPDLFSSDPRKIPQLPRPQRGISGDALSASIAARIVIAKTHARRAHLKLDTCFGYGLASHK